MGDIARYGVGRLIDETTGGNIIEQANEGACRPRERRGRSSRFAVDKTNGCYGGIGAIRRGGEIREFPILLGNQADT